MLRYFRGFLCLFRSFFFFQAEDGIRDFHVTGVQTCALPIYIYAALFHITLLPAVYINLKVLIPYFANTERWARYFALLLPLVILCSWLNHQFFRSEERRVGKECRSRWQRPE